MTESTAKTGKGSINGWTMVQNENQRAFAERLAKIEARENAAESISDKFKNQRKKGSAKQRRRGPMLFVVLLLIGIAALPILQQQFPDLITLPSLASLLDQSQDAS